MVGKTIGTGARLQCCSLVKRLLVYTQGLSLERRRRLGLQIHLCRSKRQHAAHSSHPSSTLCAQVVRLWGPRGDALAYRRGVAGLLAAPRLGSIDSIAWHPYRPLFACGGADAIVAIYEVSLVTRNYSMSRTHLPHFTHLVITSSTSSFLGERHWPATKGLAGS